MAILAHVATVSGFGGALTPTYDLTLYDSGAGRVLQAYAATGAVQGSWRLEPGALRAVAAEETGALFGPDALRLDLPTGRHSLGDAQIGRLLASGAQTLSLDDSAFDAFRVEAAVLQDWLFLEAPTGGIYRVALTAELTGASGQPLRQPAPGELGGPIDDMLLAEGRLVSVQAATDQIVTWDVGADGSLTEAGRAPWGIGIGNPTAAVAARAGDSDYLVVASSGSGSLSVFEIGLGGGLSPRDHVLDDSAVTRFAKAAVIETVTHQGQTFVIAAGADRGLSVLTLEDDGRLVHRASLGDTVATTLDQITGLAAAGDGGTLRIFAVSATERGVTELALDLGDLARVHRDDGGADTLTGGAGADLFVMAADGRADLVQGFTPGDDRLDLSDWPMLYDIRQLNFSTRDDGVRISFGDEAMMVRSADRSPLAAEDFSNATLFNLDRPYQGRTDAPPPPPAEPLPPGADILDGSTGDDRLQAPRADMAIRGLAGDDVLFALSGDNTLDGGSGTDCVDYTGAAVGVSASLARNEGQVAGRQTDRFIGIEDLSGSAFFDTLEGDGAANALWGMAAADTLDGAGGDDMLSGGTGADALHGGAGDDTLFGNTSTDTLYGQSGDDELRGGDGVDWLSGGAGDDYLIGHKGWDSLMGGDGADELRGSSGADLLLGEAGADTLHGGTGVDTLEGGDGDDVLYGNQGADPLRGGRDDDELFGGSGVDSLWGNSGDDTLWGNEGADILSAGSGADLAYGGTGDDSLDGGGGADTLFGGQGRDTLSGGSGDDFLRGGTLADVFVFSGGRDRIDDFRTIEDRLSLEAGLWSDDLTAGQVVDRFGMQTSGDYVLDFGDGNAISFTEPLDPAALAGQIDIL